LLSFHLHNIITDSTMFDAFQHMYIVRRSRTLTV